MNNTAHLMFQWFCGIGLIVTLIAGRYLLRNYDRLFGADPAVPSESSSSRGLSKVQMIAIWAHVAGFFLMGLCLLH